MSRTASIKGLGYGLFGALVGFLVFYLAGVPLFQRGPWAAVCFIVCGALFNVAAELAIKAENQRQKMAVKAPEDWPHGGIAPEPDKAKMREAVMSGVLEAIKGLVVRSENAEKELKMLKDRMSELSLAAGLKPRVARAPETREG